MNWVNISVIILKNMTIKIASNGLTDKPVLSKNYLILKELPWKAGSSKVAYNIKII